MTTTGDRRLDRARGAFLALAIGDALGMPTQMLSRAQIAASLGALDGFRDAPDCNEISCRTPAGRVTDDTDQAVILGRLLIEGGVQGGVDRRRFAEQLLAWQERMVRVGSADLLGPSTRRALEAYRGGESLEVTGRWGDTNGAAMRVTPIGIAFPSRPLPVLVDAVASTNRVTHNTTIANAGAAAIAAAVSAGIDGADMSQALDHAVTAAELGAGHGHYVAGADVAARIRWALRLVAEDPGQAPELIYRLVGTGVATTEAVPAALALASLHPRDAWQACLVAAGLGGDSDTVAAMAGAVVGACTGAEALPSHAVRTVLAANPGLPVLDLADQLVALRLRRG